jgi:hypothetical protein
MDSLISSLLQEADAQATGKPKHPLGHIPLLLINGELSLLVDTEIKGRKEKQNWTSF